MTTPSKSFFPSPIQIGTLDHFCRPIPGHPFEFPCWDTATGEALAACGYIALRATKGLWMRDGSDFTSATPEYLQRFNKLPWGSFANFIQAPNLWRDLRTSADLFKRGPLALWQDKGCPGRPYPSPVWRVNETHLVRLSHLQLISRLPACQVYVGHSENLHFRYTGGTGIIAKDDKLDTPSFSILAPTRHYDGEREPLAATPKPNLGLPNWPPKGEETVTIHD